MTLRPEQRQELADQAFAIRRWSLEMITYSTWGHIGGSFSMAELLAVLYWHSLTVDPEQPQRESRDRVILSKAHGSPGLYAALALRGFLPLDRLYTYCELGGLEGHTHLGTAPGIEASGGPLGMGLSVAVGMAMGLRYKENPRSRVVCLLGDGECNEGNVWEAAMSAAHYCLDNVIAVVDYNKAMAKGFTWDLMSIEPFADKWRAFGWNVQEIDGHDLDAIAHALHQARWVLANGKPNVIIAHTVKGKGVEGAEFNYQWHTHAPEPAVADAMMRELCRTYQQPEIGYSGMPPSGMPPSRLIVDKTKESFYGGE